VVNTPLTRYLLIITVPKHSSPLRVTFTSRNLVQLGKSSPPIHLPTYEKLGLDSESIATSKTVDKEIFSSIEKWLSNLPEKTGKEMSSVPDKYSSATSTSFGSPHRLASGRLRFGSRAITPRRLAIICGGIASLLVFELYRFSWNHCVVCSGSSFPTDSKELTTGVQSSRPAYLTTLIPYNATFIPNAPFQPPEPLPHRYSDTIDTFASYKYRNTCNISSLDLHAPFGPLCDDRKTMLTAMSSGGRIGHDAPYMPRGCDMRWFSTEEICEILARFEKVIIVGDSMMRHVIGSINVLIRKDLGYGAVTDWNFSPEER